MHPEKTNLLLCNFINFKVRKNFRSTYERFDDTVTYVCPTFLFSCRVLTRQSEDVENPWTLLTSSVPMDLFELKSFLGPFYFRMFMMESSSSLVINKKSKTVRMTGLICAFIDRHGRLYMTNQVTQPVSGDLSLVFFKTNSSIFDTVMNRHSSIWFNGSERLLSRKGRFYLHIFGWDVPTTHVWSLLYTFHRPYTFFK